MSWTDSFLLALLLIVGALALVPRRWRRGRALDRPVYPDVSASY